MPTIYVYPRGKTSHPLNPSVQVQSAQAIDEKGNEIVTFYGKDTDELKTEAQKYAWEGEDNRLKWVDDPDDHPVIPGLIIAREGREAEADLEERAGASNWKPDELEMIRQESHICVDCIHRAVCAVAAQPMFDAQKVTVAACLVYTPEKPAARASLCETID